MELPAGAGLPLSSEELAIFKERPQELPFLNVHRFLRKIGVKVPAIYGHWEDERIVFLEDLGDTALWDQVQGLADDQVLTWYRKAIDELLILHTRGTQSRDDSCIAFQQRFDAKLYLWEFDHFIEWGLEKRPDVKVSAAAITTLRNELADIAAILERSSNCLSHRDYHSWNLMIHDGAVRVIDFQDALLAPAQYDLASLLNDRVTDSVVRPHLEERLIHYYIDKSRDLSGRAMSARRIFRNLPPVGDSTGLEGRRALLLSRSRQRQTRLQEIYRADGAPAAPQLRLKTAQTKALLPLLREHFEAMQ